MTGILSSMLVLSVSSCVKDDFDRYHNASDALSFKVEVSGGWSGAAAASSTSIRRMSQSTDAEPLYLVTKVSGSAPVSAESGVVTRGTPVETVGPLETGGFGLSAICYTGDWPEKDTDNKWTTNFAHNLNVTKQGEVWKSSEKLDWPGSGNIKFFAYYPYSENVSCIEHSAGNHTGVPVLTYTVPDDVTTQPDLLWAVADHPGKSNGNSSVNLEFRHALTAVTIKAGDNMLSGIITGITISGVYGQGSCKIGGTEWTSEGDAKDFEIKDIEVVLSKETDSNGIGINTKPGTAVMPGEGYTFMMVPQTLPDEAELTIYFRDDLTKIDRTLTAKIGGSEWPSGKKVAYSINSTGIVIEPVLEMKVNRDGLLPGGGKKLADFKDIINVANLRKDGMYGDDLPSDFEKSYLPVSGYLHDVDITSYVKVIQASAGNEVAKEQYLKLPFEIEYFVDGGTDWTKGGWIPDGTAAETEAASEAVITDPKTGGILLAAQPQFTELRRYFKENGYDGGHDWLNSNGNNGTTGRKTVTDKGKGSKAAPYDLVANNPVKQESANCYIINDHGYYMFPVCYGNTYGAVDNGAYYAIPTGIVTEEGIDQKNYQLVDFVGYDNNPITSSGEKGDNGAVWINDVHDAVIIWQDSPDLVEDVRLIERNGRKWISFHTAEPALSQGNAVIAVRNASSEILWSWHIWATHYDWQHTDAMISTGVNRKDGKGYDLTPCNLGYCEPHGEDEARKISIRFKVTMPDGSETLMKPKIIDENCCPEPDADGVITFAQPEIAASVAGDNTYYQWGRKDPMLPGVYSEQIYKAGVDFYNNHRTDADVLKATQNELTMNNKMFYSTKEYRISTRDTGKSIGDAIRNPHIFFVHMRPEADADSDQNINNDRLRRHWHNGEGTAYNKHSLMNFWNSELYESNKGATLASPNDIYVRKTIYDPCPAGFKIPSPNAYAWLFIKDGNFDKGDGSGYKYFNHTNPNYIINGARVSNDGQKIGWLLPINGKTIFFPATGVRNLGLKKRDWNWGTTPAFADLTFIASAGFIDEPKTVTGDNGVQKTVRNYSCSLFSIDDRTTTESQKTKLKTSYPTSNSYGFTLRPVLDKDK